MPKGAYGAEHATPQLKCGDGRSDSDPAFVEFWRFQIQLLDTRTGDEGTSRIQVNFPNEPKACDMNFVPTVDMGCLL